MPDKALTAFAKALREAPDLAGEVMAESLNRGANHARKTSVDAMFRQINLERGYIADNLEVSLYATKGNLQSRVYANRRPVLLPRYGAAIDTRNAITPPERLKGDRARGIPPGRKAYGSKAFKVKRQGRARPWRGVFFIRLRGSNAWGMAERTGPAPKDYDLLYGPSVDQAFKSVSLEVLPEALAFVEEDFIKSFRVRS